MNVSVISPQNQKPNNFIGEFISAAYPNSHETSPSKAFSLRNEAVAKSTKDFITFYECEDIWHDSHIDILNDLNNQYFYLITPEYMHLPNDKQHLVNYFRNGEACPTGCMVINKEIFLNFGGFNTSLPHSASWDFILRLLLSPINVEVINKSSWISKHKPHSIANTRLPSHKDVIALRRQWAQNM